MPLNRIVAAAVAVIIAGPAVASTIDVFPNIGPVSVTENAAYVSAFGPPASLAGYAHNALGAMLDGQTSRGGNIADTPTAFNTLPSNAIPYNAIAATEFPTWRLNLNPTGAFAQEHGTWWRLGVRVESSTAFTLSQIEIHRQNVFEETDLALNDVLNTYPEHGFDPVLAIGIWYGPDGVRGTADDVVCDSSACDRDTQLLNLVAWRGYGQFETWTEQEMVDLYGGDKSAWVVDEAFFYSGGYGAFPDGFGPPPFEHHESITLKDTTGAVLANVAWNGFVAVPEPATWTQLLLGVGLAGLSFRRRAAGKRSRLPRLGLGAP